MNASSEDNANAGRDPQDRGPLGHQFLRTRGKTPSPPLKDRVIVYDCERKKLEVKSKKEADKGKLKQTIKHSAHNDF